MTEVSPQASHRIVFLDYLRIYGMFMVVGVHALGRTHLPESIEAVIAFIVGTVAVPIFFLVDGFLFAFYQASSQVLDYKDYVLRSAYRLLVPWISFSVVYVFLRLVLEQLGYIHDRVVIGQGPAGFLSAMYFSLAAPQMYFLLSLFFVRMLAWFYRKLLACAVQWSMLAFFAYTIVFRNSDVKSYFSPGADPLLLAVWGLQFYLLGMVLCRLHITVPRTAVWLIAFGGVTFMGCKIYRPEYHALIQYAYLVTVYAMSVILTRRFPVAPKLARHNMGIYLLHTPIMLSLVSLALGKVSDKTHILYFAAIVVATFVLSAMAARGIANTPYLRIVLGEKPTAVGTG